MSWHFAAPARDLFVATRSQPEVRMPVMAIAWDDAHSPDANSPEEFRYLVLIEDGAPGPSWILGSEVGKLHI